MFGGIGSSELCVILGVALLALPGTALWIWAIVDCASKEPDAGSTRLVWLLVIIFTHFVGALLYLLVRRPERKRTLGR